MTGVLRPVCTCWRLNTDGTHKPGCPIFARKRTEAYLAKRGPRPRITRRWYPSLDVHMRFMAKQYAKGTSGWHPWRIDLPSGQGGGHMTITEYAATHAEALDIAAWWVAPGTLPRPVVHRPSVPYPVTTDSQQGEDDDL